MTQVGYATHTDDTAKADIVDAIYAKLEREPEITAIVPGVTNCTYAIGEAAPAGLASDLEWFVETAQTYLAAPKIFDSFAGTRECDTWFKTLSDQERKLVTSNRLRVENLSRINRCLAGFTTEAFARNLPNKMAHDTLQRLYTDFNKRFKPEDYYTRSLKEREVLADDLAWRVERVLAVLEQLRYLRHI